MTDQNDAILAFLRQDRARRRWRLIAFISLLLLGLFIWQSTQHKPLIPTHEKAHIAQVEISGMILEDPYATDVLNDLAKDEQVKGLLVNIDSPGGTMVGGLSFYHNLRRIAESGKPVAVTMKTVAASGGYLAALAGDRIFASEGTLTGSIGVVLPLVDASELAGKIGIKSSDVASGDLKAVGGPLSPLAPEARTYFQNMVDELNGIFYRYVTERRTLTPDVIATIKDGRAIVGTQALKMGLIDALGTTQDAKNWLIEQAALAEDIPVLDYELEEEKDWTWLDYMLQGRLPSHFQGLLHNLTGLTHQPAALAILQ